MSNIKVLGLIILSFSCSNNIIDTAFAQSNLRLEIVGEQFALNGKPTFLLGVSYFDARNFHDSDFTKLAALGFNLVRIWLDWEEDHFFDENGDWRSGADQDLIRLVEFANSQGLAVDITILDPNMSFGDKPSIRRKIVESTARLLKGKSNVLFDLANEHDHLFYNTTISHNEASLLATVVKDIDGDLIITFSSTSCHLLCGSDENALDPNNIQSEINAGIEVLTPHFPRSNDWGTKTAERIKTIKNYLTTINKQIPLYLQEENRRKNDSGPDANEFFTSAKQALDAGAAGWIFHTSAGFDLAEKNFFENLDSVEQSVVDELSSRIFGSKQTDTIPPAPPKGLRVIL